MDHTGKTIFKNDFSSSKVIGTQIGDHVGLIQHDGIIYRFTEPGWPSAYKFAEKKLNASIKFRVWLTWVVKLKLNIFQLSYETIYLKF